MNSRGFIHHPPQIVRCDSSAGSCRRPAAPPKRLRRRTTRDTRATSDTRGKHTRTESRTRGKKTIVTHYYCCCRFCTTGRSLSCAQNKRKEKTFASSNDGVVGDQHARTTTAHHHHRRHSHHHHHHLICTHRKPRQQTPDTDKRRQHRRDLLGLESSRAHNSAINPGTPPYCSLDRYLLLVGTGPGSGASNRASVSRTSQCS